MFHVKHEQQDPLSHLHAALDQLGAQNLRRHRWPRPRRSTWDFSSNDYLGLARSAIAGGCSGAGSSRLISGDCDSHRDLEAELADWASAEDALLFSSGYAANVGALSALIGPEDLVVSDSLNHASIIDGIRLAKCPVAIVPHLDLSATRRALEGRTVDRAWVVVESYYSMDADTPDLRALASLCRDARAALYVDEAHAMGVFGDGGRGLCAEAGIVPDVLVGTLGKALGAAGAFVAGSRTLTEWLWNRARSFVFSTGMSPAVAEVAHRNLRAVRVDDEARARLLQCASRLRQGLASLDQHVLGHGPVIPWVVGEPERALRLSERLRRADYHVVAIRPPTVPAGTSRLRLTVRADMTDELIDGLLDAASRAIVEVG